MSGKLYLCATPIGNLEDMTFRGIRILNEVDLIAAEDTRHTIKLLNHYEIKTKMTSYHEHNKYEKGPRLLQKLLEGKNIAIVTDAGTPGISDPGEELVKLCIENGIEVTSAPGAVAAITALIISGMPTRRFLFEGFLPNDKKEKKFILENLKNEIRTIIIYEAPHRLKQTLRLLSITIGDREIAITRELTKKYEEVIQTTINKAIEKYETEIPRGEFAIIIKGLDIEEVKNQQKESWDVYTIEEHLEVYINKGIEKKEAIKLVSKDRGIPKREVYNLVNK